MADFVEREKIQEVISDIYKDADSAVEGACIEIWSRVKGIPAADVRPVVHGHWVYEEPNGANSFKGAYWCDQCHQPELYRKNFCHFCGADMREEN